MKWLISIVCMVLLMSCNDDKVYFINNLKVFSEFNGKRELEKEVKTFEKTLTNKLDSLRIQIIEIKNEKGDKDPMLYKLSREYTELEQYMGESLQQKNAEYTDQIWKQINEYVKQMGKEKGYKLIVGANGQGTVMYGDASIDLTEEVIEYINAKYEGF